MTLRKNIAFYQNLARLFYAIASIDNNVRDTEYNTLKQLVRDKWLDLEKISDPFGSDTAYQIEIVFDWLDANDDKDAQGCYNTFVEFKQNNKELFTPEINKLILSTAESIADSFSGKNKAEQQLLEKLKNEMR